MQHDEEQSGIDLFLGRLWIGRPVRFYDRESDNPKMGHVTGFSNVGDNGQFLIRIWAMHGLTARYFTVRLENVELLTAD